MMVLTSYLISHQSKPTSVSDTECISEVQTKKRKEQVIWLFLLQQAEDYFIEKNLEKLKSLRESVLDDRYKMYIHCHYIHEPDECNLKAYGFCKFFEEPYSNLRALRYLSESERQMVAEAIDVEIAKFTKRLKTYLKRYGLSKVNSWSYLVD